jgi:hypothetical protein
MEVISYLSNNLLVRPTTVQGPLQRVVRLLFAHIQARHARTFQCPGTTPARKCGNSTKATCPRKWWSARELVPAPECSPRSFPSEKLPVSGRSTRHALTDLQSCVASRDERARQRPSLRSNALLAGMLHSSIDSPSPANRQRSPNISRMAAKAGSPVQ